MDAGTGGPRRYDGGRKDAGRKLHLIVDTMGWLLAVVVHAADWPDQNGVFLVPQALRLADTRYRRHSRDYDKRTDHRAMMIDVSRIHLLLKRLDKSPAL